MEKAPGCFVTLTRPKVALLKDGSGRGVKRGVHKKVKVFNRVATKWRMGQEKERENFHAISSQIVKTIFLIRSS